MDTSDQQSSPSSSPQSEITAMTTPEQTSPPQPQDPARIHNRDNDNDDIWGDSSSHSGPHPTTAPNGRPQNEELLSDLPTVRRRRMADGYRDGLSQSKAQVIQSGFDQGYPVGAEIGLRTGRVLGVLEGVLAGLKRDEGSKELTKQVEKLLVEARRDLGREGLMHGVEEGEVMRDGGVRERVEGVIAEWERRVLGGWVQKESSEPAQNAVDR